MATDKRLTKRLQVSELDFNQIKTNLKDFLRSQNTLQDYDFEGSAINTLLDLMSYVTHYNAINANIGINETFLNTAQYRGSVVGHARQLGYTPRSMTGATAIIDITLNGVVDELVTLNKYHKFNTTIDNVTYNFVTTQSYESTNGIFSSIEIRQGLPKNVSYIYDFDTAERFIIPELNVDTSTIEVNVYDSQGSSTFETFELARNINNVTSTSKVYFLNEAFDGRYEITFGDDVIGQALVNGNLIEVNYLVTSAENGNGAVGFRSTDSIGGYSNITITTIQQSLGGRERETLAEIKYRAPLSYAAQNRAVTTDDYKAIILENYSDIKSISVWGGEDNDPPVYGKVFISIKPSNTEALSDDQKNYILNNIIRPKSIVSITPEFIDPEYTYVSLEVFYKYDTSETNLSQVQLSDIIRSAISSYNDSSLGSSTGVLRYSSLLNVIDVANQAITNSYARVYMKKRFVPVIGSTSNEYDLRFASPIYTSATHDHVIYKSSVFTYNGEQCTIQDYVNSTGERRLRIIRSSGVNQIIMAGDIGYVDAANGRIIISNGFNPSGFVGSYIELTVLVNSNDVAPNRNNLVTIDMNDVFIYGDVDNITSGSSAGGSNYRLIPRHA